MSKSIKNENGIDLIERFSGNEESFLFLDPPYRHDLRGKGATSAYACELLHCEQVRLLKLSGMGHTDIAVTSNVYMHLKLEDAQEELDKLAKVE